MFDANTSGTMIAVAGTSRTASTVGVTAVNFASVSFTHGATRNRGRSKLLLLLLLVVVVVVVVVVCSSHLALPRRDFGTIIIIIIGTVVGFRDGAFF